MNDIAIDHKIWLTFKKNLIFIGFSISRIKTLYNIKDYFTFVNIFRKRIFIKMDMIITCTAHAGFCAKFVRRSFNDRLY